jgi:D-glutamate N-acetyltransferase
VSDTRYLILAEGFSTDPHYAKTMRGVLRYRRDAVVAILDSARRPGETEKGVPVVQSVNDALCFNPDTALVGVATQGGRFPPAWIDLLKTCIAKGLDIENGLHVFLADDPELLELAARHSVQIRDLRRPPEDISTATGANLGVPGTIVLAVGSDCAIGKMTVCLELDRAARARGVRSVFVPTGQTGIAIAGWGIAVDAVVADFVAGAAERLVLEGAERGGDVLWVEGQGAILHPIYSGVTLGLYHGSVPHLLVLCHEAGRTHIEGAGGGPHPIPPLAELVELHERLALPVRPARVAAVALNTRLLEETAARAAIAAAEQETGLPADDPVRFGAARLADAVLTLSGHCAPGDVPLY